MEKLNQNRKLPGWASFGVVFFASFFILMFILSYDSSTYILSAPKVFKQPNYIEMVDNYTLEASKPVRQSKATLDNLKKLFVSDERISIADRLKNYTAHASLNVSSFDELIPEKGGSPIRSFIVTTWRSGSTFAAELLQSVPASFYHYEPLLPYGIRRVQVGNDSAEAVKKLRRLMKCDYDNMRKHLSYGNENQFLWIHTTAVWKICIYYPEMCLDSDFLSSVCRLYPFQSIKTVRLGLNLTEKLIRDKSLNLRIILLVRDPRGTFQSRLHRDWCPGQTDCDDPAKLCSDLVDDYHSAKKFAKLFPDDFRVLRYEDLAFDIHNVSKKVMDFLRLKHDESVDKFIETHTKTNIGGVSSTYRDTKTAPIHWRSDLTWQNVSNIQKICSTALKLWGYDLATEETLETFNPVGNLSFPDVLIS